MISAAGFIRSQANGHLRGGPRRGPLTATARGGSVPSAQTPSMAVGLGEAV